jgi:hypothetical protein
MKFRSLSVPSLATISSASAEIRICVDMPAAPCVKMESCLSSYCSKTLFKVGYLFARSLLDVTGTKFPSARFSADLSTSLHNDGHKPSFTTDTEDMEKRVFAHSREIPRMGKCFVRLRRKAIHVIPCPTLLNEEVHSSALVIQNLLPQVESHLSFAGISRQMKDLSFSASSVAAW